MPARNVVIDIMNDMFELIIFTSFSLILALWSYEDLRKGVIKIYQLVCLLFEMVLYSIFSASESRELYFRLAIGALIGMILLGITVISECGLGAADSFVLLIMFFYLGGGPFLTTLFISSFSAFILASLYILRSIFGKSGVSNLRRKSIPFIPFVFVGYSLYISCIRSL